MVRTAWNNQEIGCNELEAEDPGGCIIETVGRDEWWDWKDKQGLENI